MKTCNKCNELKSITEFYKQKGAADGYKCVCKKCDNLLCQIRNRSRDGVSTKIYAKQRGSCRKRGHTMPSYTVKELRVWMQSQDNFNEIYNNWVNSDYDKMLAPSVDRIDNDLSYTFDNIQLMTWQENKDKNEEEARNGKMINAFRSYKAVKQYDMNGNFIKEYISIAQAGRDTSIGRGDIGKACKCEVRQAGGFIWKYK